MQNDHQHLDPVGREAAASEFPVVRDEPPSNPASAVDKPLRRSTVVSPPRVYARPRRR